MIEQGWGCDPDPNAAAALYRDAAKEGCAEAENNLGALLYLGMATDTSSEGPRGDPDEDAANAAALFHRARSRGLGAACSNLALCYEEGRGVRGGQDLDRARALYDEAARGGVVSAFAGCGSVALMRGDLRDAVASFRVGAAQGSDDASERLRALTLRHRRGKALVGVVGGGGGGG
jgi:TPR repeat protein